MKDAVMHDAEQLFLHKENLLPAILDIIVVNVFETTCWKLISSRREGWESHNKFVQCLMRIKGYLTWG